MFEDGQKEFGIKNGFTVRSEIILALAVIHNQRAHTKKNVLLNQQKFGWPNKVFRLNMGQ